MVITLKRIFSIDNNHMDISWIFGVSAVLFLFVHWSHIITLVASIILATLMSKKEKKQNG